MSAPETKEISSMAQEDEHINRNKSHSEVEDAHEHGQNRIVKAYEGEGPEPSISLKTWLALFALMVRPAYPSFDKSAVDVLIP